MGQSLPWRVVAALLLGLAGGALAALWLTDVFRDPARDPVAKKNSAQVYVVQRLYWHYRDRSLPNQETDPTGGGFPEKVFRDRAAAEAYRAAREREERKGRCPFEHGRGWGQSFPSLADFTTMATGDFLDWLATEGLSLPEGQRAAWEFRQQHPEHTRGFDQDSYNAWWSWWNDTLRNREGEPKCDRVWDKLDRVRFFEIIEVKAEL